MDVRERGEVFSHLDHVDRYRIVVEPAREQSVAGVTRRRLLLHGHRGLERHLSKSLSQHSDHIGPGFLVGSAIRGNATRIEGSAGSSVGSGDGGWFLAVQRYEVAADDHTTATAEPRLGEDREDLEVHEASDHQPIAAERGGDMDVEAEREQRVRLRDRQDQRAAQVSPSDEAKLLHVGCGRSGRHTRRLAAEPRQRRVSGESPVSPPLCVVVSMLYRRTYRRI